MKLFDGLHEDVDRLYECGYFERVITSKNDIVSREPLPLRGKKKGLERDYKKNKQLLDYSSLWQLMITFIYLYN